ncbi:MAG TPA: GGDEF domain-containing protein [Drouetiella sp.]
MTDQPTPTNEKETRLQRIFADSKKRRGVPAGYAGDQAMLNRVRDIEKASTPAAQMATISSARGEDIERLALIDGLTELYNYKTFLKELKAEVGRSQRYKHSVALCLMAIDDFEAVTQQYGPLTGDAVMKVVANVLRGAVRELDIPAKYSDNQFCVVLPQTHAAGASLLAERIRQRIGNQAITHNWQSFSVTASLGVAAYPTHAEEYDELIARASEALEYAIARGGDRVFSV